MNAYIITGASQGLGNSIARKLVDKSHYLFCVARKTDGDLMRYAKEKECNLDFIEFDLSNSYEIEKLMNTIFDKINLSEIESISLINNAGVVSPIKPIENCKDNEIINNINVNLLAPIILTSSFIRNLTNFVGKKNVISISSGAGKKPYYGWSNYCASKAGIDIFTQCIGIEQNTNTNPNPVNIMSLVPFVMDTEMQEEIRKTDKGNFKEVEKFNEFKNEGKLLPVDFVAEKVIRLLKEKEFIQGGVIDIGDIR